MDVSTVGITSNTQDRGHTLALQERAYQAFRGDKFVEKTHSIHLKVLYGLIHSPNVDQTLAEKVFEAAQEDFKNFQPFQSQEPPKEFRPLEESDDLIDISYGGGQRFLQDFLNSEHIGYAHEAQGKGMFVTVDPTMNRDTMYAIRTPLQYFDDPVVLTARIAKRHLQRVNYNSYEAVLPQKSVKHLQNVTIKNHELRAIEGWKMAIADLLPLLPMFGDLEQSLTQKLKETGKYSADEVRDIVSCLSPLYL